MKPLAGYDPSLVDASNQTNNVAKVPSDPACACTPGNCSCGPSCNCTCCYGNGPGGNITLRQYNEKGILETGLFAVISRHQEADLGSQHDPMRRGIYTTNSRGDND